VGEVNQLGVITMINRKYRGASAVLAAAPIAAFFAICAPARTAHAVTINVNTFDMTVKNDKICGLVEALAAVNTKAASNGCPAGTGNDTIQLQSGTYLANPSFPLTISRSVTIKGTTPDPALGAQTRISGTNLLTSNDTLFKVTDPNGAITVNFQFLDLFGGAGTQMITGIWAQGTKGSTVHVLGSLVELFTYGGIYSNSTNIDVQDTYLAQNSTPENGGAIFFDATSKNLTVSRSTFEGNTSPNFGGAISYLGIGTSSITSSTLAGNSAASSGAIDNGGTAGSFAINGCTIAYNFCTTQGVDCGGGVVSFLGDSTAHYSMNASIVANNQDGDSQQSDFTSDDSVVVTNSDILGIGSATFIDGGGNQLMGVDPQTDPDLIRIGGIYRLPIVQVSSTSPVLDVLSSFSPTVDERGLQRGVSHDGKTHSALFDLGAYEFDPNTQVETLPLIASSQTLIPITNNTGYSDSRGSELPATKAGDAVSYYLPSIVIEDGSYDFVARYATGKNEGIVQLEWSTDKTFKTGVMPIGGPVDLFASTAGFTTKDFHTSFFFSGDDPIYLRFRVTGKNSHSTGFALFLDYVNAISI
jgi:hypothetical protein